MTTERITGHYWANNIFAIREWAIRQLDARRSERGNGALEDLEDWCRVWLENDPLDNGGDGSVRREMRPEWRGVYRSYLALRRAADNQAAMAALDEGEN